jgi:hypothetical protein
VHPLAVAACGHEAGVAEDGQVAGDLRLRLAEDFDEETDADLAVGDEVQQAQARAVGEGLEENVEFRGCFHMRRIRIVPQPRPQKCSS